MLTIARLFGKSPFPPLQTHMDKVIFCIGELPNLFKAFLEQGGDVIQKIGQKISQLEHEADLTKNDIRNHLPKSLFLPLEFIPEIREDLSAFCQKNIEVFRQARQVIKELEDLLSAGSKQKK